jgi:hypothetical protein
MVVIMVARLALGMVVAAIVVVRVSLGMIVIVAAMVIALMARLAVGGRFGRQLNGAAQLPCAGVEDLRQIHLRAVGAMHFRQGVHPANAVFHPLEIRRGDQVGLVEQNDIGKGDLLCRLGGLVQHALEMPGISHGDNAIQPQMLLKLRQVKSVRDGAGIGEAGCLDQHVIEPLLALLKVGQCFDEIAPHPAAQAAVVQLHDLFIRANHQLPVNADLTKLIDDDRQPVAMRLGEQMFQEGCFAGAQKAGEDRDGDRLLVFLGHTVRGAR